MMMTFYDNSEVDAWMAIKKEWDDFNDNIEDSTQNLGVKLIKFFFLVTRK